MTSFEREAAEAARGVLLKDIRNNVSITVLVNESGMAQTKLKEVFKELTGMSIYEFLTFHRIQKAKELLANTELSIIQISRAVGYKRIDSFSRRFKQVEKMSPDHYRKQSNN